MHSRWLDNGAIGAADTAVGVHFFVDDHKAIQKLPLNENSWHAGDGATGDGNRTSLSFEFCVNSDGDFEATFRHQAELFGYIMYKLGIDPYYCYQHNYWSGKDCPRLLRQQDRWSEAEGLIKQYHHEFGAKKYATPAAIPFTLGVDLGWQKIGNTDVYSFVAQGTARGHVVKRAWAQDKAPVSGEAYELGDRITLCGHFRAADQDDKDKIIRWYLDKDGNRIRWAKVATAFQIKE
jgi:hypothetical protein